MNVLQGERLKTIEGACQYLNMGRTKVFELLKQGQIESVKIGRSRRIPVDALDRYVESLRDQVGTAA